MVPIALVFSSASVPGSVSWSGSRCLLEKVNSEAEALKWITGFAWQEEVSWKGRLTLDSSHSSLRSFCISLLVLVTAAEETV